MAYELLRLGTLAHKRHDSSALVYALLKCNPVLVSALLKRGASVEERYVYTNEMPLHRAASNGCIASVQILLKAGADVNAETDYGTTALFGPAVNGSVDIAKLLVDAGATVDKKEYNSATPMLYAVSKGHALVVGPENRSLLILLHISG
jgi:ankyrin repeat protein